MRYLETTPGVKYVLRKRGLSLRCLRHVFVFFVIIFHFAAVQGSSAAVNSHGFGVIDPTSGSVRKCRDLELGEGFHQRAHEKPCEWL